MTLIDTLKADYKKLSNPKEFRIEEVNGLGYLISDRQMVIGKPPLFELGELVDDRTKKPAPFCYLYYPTDGIGWLLPETYDHYDAIVDADKPLSKFNLKKNKEI
jgi:hypothetical protein